MKKIIITLILMLVSVSLYSKPKYYFYLEKNYTSTGHLFSVLEDQGFNSTDNLFKWCCDCISYYAKLTGYTYEEMNIILFVILQPVLIILFVTLFIRERYKRNIMQRECRQN